MSSYFLSALMFLLPLQSATNSKGEMLSRTYDLSAFSEASDHQSVPEAVACLPFSMPFSPQQQQQESIELALGFDSQSVQEMILALTGTEFQYPERSLKLEGSSLQVTAPTSIHETVQQVLSFLEQKMSTNITLSLDYFVLRSDANVTLNKSITCPLDQIDRLIEEARPGIEKRNSFELNVRPGGAAFTDVTKKLSFIKDWDAQIAQASVIADPVKAVVTVGTKILLRATPLKNGTALEIVSMRNDLPNGIRTREIPMKGATAKEEQAGQFEIHETARIFQSPDSQVRSLVLNTFLPDKQALILNMNSELSTGKYREVLVIRRTNSKASAADSLKFESLNKELTVLNGEIFKLPSVAPRWDLNQIEELVVQASSSPESGEAHRDKEKFESLVQKHFSTKSSGYTGTWLWRVDNLNTNPKPSLSEYESRPQLIEASISVKQMGNDRNLPVQLQLPLRIGEASGGFFGGADYILNDYDVQVATGSMIPDPNVFLKLDGLLFSVLPKINRNGDLTLSILARANLRVGPIQELDLKNMFTSKIEQVIENVLVVNEKVVFPNGDKQPKRILIGDSSNSNDALCLVIELK